MDFTYLAESIAAQHSWIYYEHSYGGIVGECENGQKAFIDTTPICDDFGCNLSLSNLEIPCVNPQKAFKCNDELDDWMLDWKLSCQNLLTNEVRDVSTKFVCIRSETISDDGLISYPLTWTPLFTSYDHVKCNEINQEAYIKETYPNRPTRKLYSGFFGQVTPASSYKRGPYTPHLVGYSDDSSLWVQLASSCSSSSQRTQASLWKVFSNGYWNYYMMWSDITGSPGRMCDGTSNLGTSYSFEWYSTMLSLSSDGADAFDPLKGTWKMDNAYWGMRQNTAISQTIITTTSSENCVDCSARAYYTLTTPVGYWPSSTASYQAGMKFFQIGFVGKTCSRDYTMVDNQCFTMESGQQTWSSGQYVDQATRVNGSGQTRNNIQYTFGNLPSNPPSSATVISAGIGNCVLAFECTTDISLTLSSITATPGSGTLTLTMPNSFTQNTGTGIFLWFVIEMVHSVYVNDQRRYWLQITRACDAASMSSNTTDTYSGATINHASSIARGSTASRTVYATCQDFDRYYIAADNSVPTFLTSGSSSVSFTCSSTLVRSPTVLCYPRRCEPSGVLSTLNTFPTTTAYIPNNGYLTVVKTSWPVYDFLVDNTRIDLISVTCNAGYKYGSTDWESGFPVRCITSGTSAVLYGAEVEYDSTYFSGEACIDRDECVEEIHNCQLGTICRNTIGSFACDDLFCDLDAFDAYRLVDPTAYPPSTPVDTSTFSPSIAYLDSYVSPMYCNSPYVVASGDSVFYVHFTCVADVVGIVYPKPNPLLYNYDPVCVEACGEPYFPTGGRLLPGPYTIPYYRSVGGTYIVTDKFCDTGFIPYLESISCTKDSTTGVLSWATTPCADVDECTEMGSDVLCGTEAVCVNTYGSFQCDCLPNYAQMSVVGKQVCDYDECNTSEPLMRDKCDTNADCVNTYGGYSCDCKTNYWGSGYICKTSTCDDYLLGGDEEGVDCAGSCSATCLDCPAPPQDSSVQFVLTQPSSATSNKYFANYTCVDSSKKPTYIASWCEKSAYGTSWLPSVPPDCSSTCPTLSLPNIDQTGCVQDTIPPIISCNDDFNLFVPYGGSIDITDSMFTIDVVDETRTRIYIQISNSAHIYVLGSCPGSICGTVNEGRYNAYITVEDATMKTSTCEIGIHVFPNDGRLLDECTDQTHNCPTDQTSCVNVNTASPDGYYCECLKTSLIYNSSLRKCELPTFTSADAGINECTLQTHGCNFYADCTDESLGYSCECIRGYVGDGLTCVASTSISLSGLLPLSTYLEIYDVVSIGKMGDKILSLLLAEEPLMKLEDVIPVKHRLIKSILVTSDFLTSSSSVKSNSVTCTLGGSLATSQLVILQDLFTFFTDSYYAGNSTIDDVLLPVTTSLSALSGLVSSVAICLDAMSLTDALTATNSAVTMISMFRDERILLPLSPEIDTLMLMAPNDAKLLSDLQRDAVDIRESLSKLIAKTIAIQSAAEFVKNSASTVNIGVHQLFLADGLEYGFTFLQDSKYFLPLNSSDGWSVEMPFDTDRMGNADLCSTYILAYTDWGSNWYNPSLMDQNGPDNMISLNIFGVQCVDSVSYSNSDLLVEIDYEGLNWKTNPIKMKLPINRMIEDYEKRALCGFYDSDTGELDFSGCLRAVKQETDANMDSITCECTHLTDFSAMLRDVVVESYSDLSGRIWHFYFDRRNVAFWTSLFFLIIALLVIARAIARDIKFPTTDEDLLLVYCNDKLIIEKLRSIDGSASEIITEVNVLTGKLSPFDLDPRVRNLQFARGVNAHGGIVTSVHPFSNVDVNVGYEEVNDKQQQLTPEIDSSPPPPEDKPHFGIVDAENTGATKNFDGNLLSYVNTNSKLRRIEMNAAATKIVRAWRGRKKKPIVPDSRIASDRWEFVYDEHIVDVVDSLKKHHNKEYFLTPDSASLAIIQESEQSLKNNNDSSVANMKLRKVFYDSTLLVSTSSTSPAFSHWNPSTSPLKGGIPTQKKNFNIKSATSTLDYKQNAIVDSESVETDVSQNNNSNLSKIENNNLKEEVVNVNNFNSSLNALLSDEAEEEAYLKFIQSGELSSGNPYNCRSKYYKVSNQRSTLSLSSTSLTEEDDDDSATVESDLNQQWISTLSTNESFVSRRNQKADSSSREHHALLMIPNTLLETSGFHKEKNKKTKKLKQFKKSKQLYPKYDMHNSDEEFNLSDDESNYHKVTPPVKAVINTIDPTVDIAVKRLSFFKWSIWLYFQRAFIFAHPITCQEIGFKRSSLQYALRYASVSLGFLFFLALYFCIDEKHVSDYIEGHRPETEIIPDDPVFVIPMPFSMSFLGPFDYDGINFTKRGMLVSLVCWVASHVFPFLIDLLFIIRTPFIKRLEPRRNDLQFYVRPYDGIIPCSLMTEHEKVRFVRKVRLKNQIGYYLSITYFIACTFFLFTLVLAMGSYLENDERWRQTSDFFFAAIYTNFMQLIAWPLFAAIVLTLLMKCIFMKTRMFDKLLKLCPQITTIGQPENFRDCRTAQFETYDIRIVLDGHNHEAYYKDKIDDKIFSPVPGNQDDSQSYATAASIASNEMKVVK